MFVCALMEINLLCWLKPQDTARLAVPVLNLLQLLFFQRAKLLPTHRTQCGFHVDVGCGVEEQVRSDPPGLTALRQVGEKQEGWERGTIFVCGSALINSGSGSVSII